jgi:Tol biopolymer transport system component
LLFNQNESVVAQPFDASTQTLSGKPQLVPDLYNTAVSYAGSPILSASRDGKLIQRELNLSGNLLQVLDRRGRLLRRLAIPPGNFGVPAFSPDQTRLAVAYSRGSEFHAKVWLIDLERDLSTRFSFSQGYDTSPMWTRDGLRVVWGSDLESGRELFWKRADGSGTEELFADVPNLFNDPTCITSRFVVFQSLSGATNLDLMIVPLDGEHVPQMLMQTPFDEGWATVSPDERWMAYRSNESGREEIYVVSFPDMAQKTRVSNAGTVPSQQTALGQISWRSDGKELYYVAEDRRTIMAVPVETGTMFRAGAPKTLFRCSRETEGIFIAPDGQRVLTAVPAEPNARSIVNLVIDWSAGLQSTTR